MGKKDLQAKRDKIKALYGSSADEERFIDVKANKRTIKKCVWAILFVTALATVLFLICYKFDQKGYVYGIGEESNGKKFYGFVNIDKIETQYAENEEDLSFKYLNVIDIVVVGGIAIGVFYLMILITLIDHISLAKKNIAAYKDFIRRKEIMENEERERQLELLHNKNVTAPKLDKEDMQK